MKIKLNICIIIFLILMSFITYLFFKEVGKLPTEQYCNTPHSFWDVFTAWVIFPLLFFWGYIIGRQDGKN